MDAINKLGLAKLGQAEQTLDHLREKATVTDKTKQEEAASEFEAIFIQQMVDTMWKTVPKSDLFGGGYEQEMYQDMLQKEMSHEMSREGTFGIKDMILKEFSHMEPTAEDFDTVGASKVGEEVAKESKGV